MGKLRSGTKSDLLGCLEDLVPSQASSPRPSVQVSIIDGAAIVNMLQPGVTKKFTDYAKQVFMPYIVSQLQHVSRLDVVWDKYFPHSLKADTRSKRAREFVDVLSPKMPFLDTGRSFFVVMPTRWSCSHSWQLALKILTLRATNHHPSC